MIRRKCCVKYYRLLENRGVSGARNFGVEKALYDIIAFHNSDDIWPPQKVEKQMELFEKQSELGLVYTAYLMRLQYDILHVVPQEDGSRNLSGDIFRDLLIRKYRKQYLKTGLFDKAVEGLLQEANDNKVLQLVEQMLVHYLSM